MSGPEDMRGPGGGNGPGGLNGPGGSRGPEDIQITADRKDVHIGEEFAVLIAPRELTHRDRAADGIAYVIAVDDSWSMEVRADSSSDEFGHPSRKDVAVEGVKELLAALPGNARVQVITFAQEAGVRFTGTAGELRSRGRWNGNIEDERRWTNIEGALTRAYLELDKQSAASRRVVLVSDGLPNWGAGPDTLPAIARAAADRGLHTDTVGIGAGADFGLLERLAATGMAEHVASRSSAAKAMRGVAARFAAFGREVVAGSAELVLEINPYFPVIGVYQLDPARRRIEGAVADGGGRRPSRIHLRLGAIGAGEAGQPLYVLKLRAPERVSAAPMPVVKAAGTIGGSGRGSYALNPAQLAVSTVDNPMAPILQRDLLRQVDGIELDREITDRAARAGSAAEREDIYREGAHRARQIPDQALAATYDQAGGGLREGLDPKDVANEARASSSRSSTKSKRDWFQEIPVEMPDEIRARRRRQSLDDDDDDDGDYGDADGYGNDAEYGGVGYRYSGGSAYGTGPSAPYGSGSPRSRYEPDDRTLPPRGGNGS